MRRIPAKIISPALQFFTRNYFKRPRKYRYKSIRAVVNPGVFFPHFTISTKLLMEFLNHKELKGKSFLELGCGTGIVSVFAAQKEAIVTASDINPAAIKNAEENANRNEVVITTHLSDLFAEIPIQVFDYVVINPPYYPRAPKNFEEEAWFCGENFEYFTNLFPQLAGHTDDSSQIFMILSEDCDFKSISTIAQSSNWKFDTVFTKKKMGEISLIYQLSRIDA